MKSVSLARLFATPWTVAHQAPPSMEFSRQEYWMHACMLSHFSRVQLYATLWTAAHQVPLSMGFSRQESWNRLPFPSPGDLPDQGFKPQVFCIVEILYHWAIGEAITSFFIFYCHWFWRRQWHPTPVLVPGKSQGWRSLVGYSPWGR